MFKRYPLVPAEYPLSLKYKFPGFLPAAEISALNIIRAEVPLARVMREIPAARRADRRAFRRKNTFIGKFFVSVIIGRQIVIYSDK